MNPLPDIHQLLPQQPPFQFIDRLVRADELSAVTELTVKADTPFVENGVLQASGVVENIAQTCAAHIGFLHWPDIRIGLVGAVPSLQIFRLPQTGETVTTTIQVEAQALGMTAVKADVHAGGETLAEGSIKIVLTGQTLPAQ